MQHRRPTKLLVLDAAGALCVSALLFAFCWLVLLRNDSPARTIEILSGSVEILRTDLGKLQARRDEQAKLVAQRRMEIAEVGTAPQSIALDEYFHALARQATDLGLQVRRQNPLSPRVYPGLLEQRYACEVAGSLDGIIRFLRSVEDSDVWADVGYLRVATERKSNPWATTERTAQLTISLFTSLPQTAGVIGEQG